MNRKPELAMMDAPSTQREGAAPRRLDDAGLVALVVRLKAWGRV
ncbi:MAG: tRNA epoxyqueuosine(34) reductase QueG, partial [Burkholderia gladioli]